MTQEETKTLSLELIIFSLRFDTSGWVVTKHLMVNPMFLKGLLYNVAMHHPFSYYLFLLLGVFDNFSFLIKLNTSVCGLICTICIVNIEIEVHNKTFPNPYFLLKSYTERGANARQFLIL